MATRQREKTEKLEQNRDKRPTAIAKYIRIPSGKIEIVLDLIRGKGYEEAVDILKNTNKSASPVILKVLNSAAANAENNLNMPKDSLYVAECWAMAGPTLKRMMPRARGRADRILKRSAHIRIILDQREVVKPKPKAKKDAAKVVASEANKSVKKEVNVKTSGNNKPTPKAVPKNTAERPLTDKPNAKKPLGAKPVITKVAAKPMASKAAANKAAQVKKDAKTDKGGK